MLPLSFRLVLASHYFCVDRSKLLVHFFCIQHASLQNFHCITPFCCLFFSSYCFTVARVPFETVGVISYVPSHLLPFHGYSSHNFSIPSHWQGVPSGHAAIRSQREGSTSSVESTSTSFRFNTPDLNLTPAPPQNWDEHPSSNGPLLPDLNLTPSPLDLNWKWSSRRRSFLRPRP
jgi:hypothetical protein